MFKPWWFYWRDESVATNFTDEATNLSRRRWFYSSDEFLTLDGERLLIGYSYLQQHGIRVATNFTDEATNLSRQRWFYSSDEFLTLDGERLLIGYSYLQQHGIRVPWAKVRASIHHVDPVNTSIRRSITIRRCVCHMEGPTALWHIDGHHI